MKKIIIVIAVLVLTVGIGTTLYFSYNKSENEKKELERKNKLKEQEKKALKEIQESYGEFVKLKRDTKLYKLVGKKYEENGEIYKNAVIELESIAIEDTSIKYFKFKNSDYYVSYKDIIPTDEINYNYDYKNYISLGLEIKTKKPITFYKNNKALYSINEEFSFKVIINDTDNYYVEFNGELLSVKKSDIAKETKTDINKKVASKIAVLNYHFFFDKATESCNEIICLEKSKFKEQLKYLKEEGFYAVTMNDFNLWMDKKINLPEKSLLITIDDGAMGTDTHLLELLKEYEMNATLFLITGWWPKDKYESDYLEIQSHGYDMHDRDKNGNSVTLSMKKDEIISDLKKSLEVLGTDTIAFCYPLYATNNNIIEAVKETGFQLGFVGGNVKASQSSNKLKIPRHVILDSITMQKFKDMVN